MVLKAWIKIFYKRFEKKIYLLKYNAIFKVPLIRMFLFDFLPNLIKTNKLNGYKKH